MFMVPATLDDRSAGFTAKGRSMVADQGQADESIWAAGLRGFDRHYLANPMGRRGRAAVGNHNTLALRGRREYADRDAEPALGGNGLDHLIGLGARTSRVQPEFSLRPQTGRAGRAAERMRPRANRA